MEKDNPENEENDKMNISEEVELEDFEEFDFRDLMNVVAYFTMTSGSNLKSENQLIRPCMPNPP